VRKRDDIDIKCLRCHRPFILSIFLKKPTDSIYDEKEQNRLKYLSQNEKLKETVPIFEQFLSWWFKMEFLPFKNRLIDAYFLLLISISPFLFIQFSQIGSYSIFRDFPFIVLFILIGILIYVFYIFNEQFHRSLNLSELPLNLSEEYKKSRAGHLFESWIIKDRIYDFRDIPFLNKKIHRATANGIIFAFVYLCLYSLLVLGLHKNLFFEQIGFNSLMAISYLVFWLIVCFILGNIMVLTLRTASTVFRIFEKIPVKIDIYKKIGGFDSIINLCNLIICQISILFLIAVVWVIGLVNINFLKIDYNGFLRDPVGIALICVIIILMLWLYVRPMLMVIKKYQQAKRDYLDKLGSTLKSFHSSDSEKNNNEEFQKTQYDYDHVNKLPDWPTNITINLIISMAIPIVSWLISYISH